MKKNIVLIPTRLESRRLPRKALLEIDNLPVIVHTAKRALLAKKVKDLARKSALSHKVKEKSLFIIENFDLKQPKTKEFVSILSNFSIESKKSLLFTSENSKNIVLSSGAYRLFSI